MERTNRPARSVAIADHIWDAFDEMARAMGTDRDGLINQAMFMFARLNGFLESGGEKRPAVDRSASRPTPVAPLHSPPHRTPAPAPLEGTFSGPAPRLAPKSAEPVVASSGGAAARMPEPLFGVESSSVPLPPIDDATPEPMPAPIDFGSTRDPIPSGPELSRTAEPIEEVDDGEGGLILESDAGEERVAKDRFVIGRGRHCDFVINSGKVSREHAALIREGDDWYIEDLGSANGTWFNKQRIKRRRIEDGDEYFVCSERIRFAFR